MKAQQCNWRDVQNKVLSDFQKILRQPEGWNTYSILHSIIRVVKKPQISCKSAKSHRVHKLKQAKYHEIHKKSYQMACRYNIFETYIGCWGCLLAINMEIISSNSVTHFLSALLLKQWMMISVKTNLVSNKHKRIWYTVVQKNCANFPAKLLVYKGNTYE